MLNLMLGRPGSGKTTKMLKLFCERGRSRRQLYLVPEQYSHEAERLLCKVGGPETSAYGEVLSFTRLANRVFAGTGGLAVPVLDNGGRLLLMHRALKSVEAKLGVYQRPSRRTPFLTGLMATADELKSCCISPERLSQVGGELEGEEGSKLRDLGLIFSAYDALVAQRAADPRDRLTRLAEGLNKSSLLAGSDIYIDNFVDFTPQEQLVLRQMLRQAYSVTVAVTCQRLEEEPQIIWQSARRTVYTLQKLAAEVGVGCKISYCEDTPGQKIPELRWLEEKFLPTREEESPWPEETEVIQLVKGDTPFDQLEFAAGRILELVREKGWRWRDIGVTARTMEGWGEEVESVFRRWNIPVFLSRMTDVLQKPVLTLITSALEAVAGGYEYDDLFRYLKTGLTGLEADKRDILENYVLRWDIRGSKWSREAPWSWHPVGYAMPWSDSDRVLVEELDGMRRQVIAPLERLRTARAKTGYERTLALYELLEEIGLRERLSQRTQELTDRGELNQAEEYRQLWEILCNALEQCANLLGEEEIELSEFSQLFQLVLSQYDVGSIPVALDRVTVGDAPRMAHKELKCLIVLGAEDTQFPQVSEGGGLLNDDDRALLRHYGMTTAPSREDRLEREWAIMSQMLAVPTEQLVICRSDKGNGGEEQRPSVLYTRLEELFPRCRKTASGEKRWEYRLSSPSTALECLAESRDEGLLNALVQLPETHDRAKRLERSFLLERGNLSPEAVRRLYGENIRLSASKMDKLKACHFSYFMQYGLKANVRKQAGFQAPEAGTFVHYVLEHVLKTAKELGGVKECSQDAIRTMTRQAVEDYITQELGGIDDQPQRFRYLFLRLVKSVDLVVDNVVEELRSSLFQPIDFELGFGSGSGIPVEIRCGDVTLSITGFVDRVDGWYHDGRLYYRVVDYKTGKKSLDFTDVWNGLGLQMLIYLFTLQEKGERALGETDPVPAGVLYLPAREVIVAGERGMDAGVKKKAVDKQLVRSGLLLNDPEVLEAMEENLGETGSRFLPVRVNKGGTISGDALADMAQMGRLRKHLNRVLDQISREFAGGNIDADPYYRGMQKSACMYCDYRSACHFEEGQGRDCRRYLAAVSAREFWGRLEEKEGKEGR